MASERSEFPGLPEIQALDDWSETYDVFENFHVSCEDLQSVEDMKDRLVLEYFRLKGRQYKTEVSKAIVESGEDDEKKRKQLIDMLKEVMRVTHPVTQTRAAEMLEEFLGTEGTTTDIRKDCDQRIDNLGSGECVILVAGESSAGKSSVLNLLFGETILPVFTGSCTATITTVRYGPRSATIIFNDPGLEAENLALDEEAGRKRFDELVFLKGEAREEGHSIAEIQLRLPLWFLRTGLVLADTPGVGENAFLENYLIDYIGKNQILGFMYIIMSDNALGVSEDRLLLLLKAIIEQQKSSAHNLPFDPKAALFVCNRFDAVPEDAQPKVRDHILAQLGKFWPEFESSQTVFFSAKKAQRDVDAHPDYINAQYRALLDQLKKLACVSMDRRIKSSYKWIERLLHRITHFLKSTTKRLDMSERDGRDKTKVINKKLVALKNKTNTVVMTLEADIKVKAARISREVKEFIQKPQTKFLLCSAWKEGEIPELSETVKSVDHWYWVKERIDLAFYDRLGNLLEEWGEDNCNIKEIEAKVVEDIRAQLGILEEEICDMEHDMQVDTSSLSSQSDDDARPKTTSRRISMGRRLSLGVFKASSTLVDEPTGLSLRVLLAIKKELPTENIFTKGIILRKSKAFTKNPQVWAKERAEKLLKKLLSESESKHRQGSILDELVMQLLQRPVEYIRLVKEKLPNLLKANEQLLQSIESARLSERQNIATFENMMKEVENLRISLKNYGEGYIFVDDFRSNEVKILQTVQSGQSLAKTFTGNVRNMIGSAEDMPSTEMNPRGLWSIINKGILQRGDAEQPIAIRFYLPSSGVENTFAEVAKLRCLTHDDMPLAEFLGIHHAEFQLPAYIYSGNLRSVRLYLLNVSNPRAKAPYILTSTADALCYIHGKGLVHMELSAATVTVDDAGAVKLTGACMPRRATLPIDDDKHVADFVYLSPEVLAGDLYIASSDVYGLGLLMFELLTQKIPFQRERRFTFQSFVSDVNPTAMLFPETGSDASLPAKMFELINKCVSPRDSDRPHVADIADWLKEAEHTNDCIRKSISKMTPMEVFRRSSSPQTNLH